MNRSRLLCACVLLLPLAGCAGTPSRSESRPTTAAGRTTLALEKQLAAGRHAEVIDAVDERVPHTDDPVERADLQVLKARALLADGRARSALLTFQLAEHDLDGKASGPMLHIVQGQGNAEMALEHWRPAIQQYARALKLEGLSARQQDELAYSAYIAASQSGDSSTATWRSRIKQFSDDRLAALEHRLLPVREEAPAPAAPHPSALVHGAIPDDPRDLLAEIHRRGEWGARAIKGDYEKMAPITRITVHHSAEISVAGSTASEAGELRDMQASHQAKWADLGYHFVIDPTGGIWEGRALKWQGAHEGVGLNQGAIGICLMGNFETQPLPAAQTAALSRLLDSLCKHFGVDAAHIKTHREVRPDPTDCPGAALQAWIDNYRRAVAGRSLARQ